MRLIPVLDLREGEAVTGTGGDRAHYAPVESVLTPACGDALALARAYADVLQTTELYVADLDAIGGGAPQYVLYQRLARIARPMVDAGVRTEDAACAAIDAGADRVVVGLETLPGFTVLRAIVRRLGAARAVFSLDLRGGRPVAATDVGALAPREIARRAVDAGVGAVIVLDLARVGGAAGVDERMVTELRAALPGVDLIVGGGIGSREDLDRLAAAGANGALVATVLHRGTIGAGWTRRD